MGISGNNMGNKTKLKKSKNTKKNESIKSYGKSGVVGGIYTYKKHKKSKRLGKTCIYFNKEKLTCGLTHHFCKDADNCNSYSTHSKEPVSQRTVKQKKHSDPELKERRNIGEVGITGIVLNDNRKCTNDNHKITDVNATLRIGKTDGEILNYIIPAAYCEMCDRYFVLKRDYKNAKSQGVILCPIIDMTGKVNNQNKKILSTSESRIHQLGYNVKQGNGYTKEQRQLILANILENTNISKHEIESCILRPMQQHKNQSNYSSAVSAWEQDLKFIREYKLGDIQEVIIDKNIIGKRI